MCIRDSFHQCKGDRTARRHKYDTLELRADGYQTKGRLRVSLSLQNGADIHLIVAQKRKGMPPVDDLRRKDGKYLLHEIFTPEMLRFFAQVRKDVYKRQFIPDGAPAEDCPFNV